MSFWLALLCSVGVLGGPGLYFCWPHLFPRRESHEEVLAEIDRLELELGIVEPPKPVPPNLIEVVRSPYKLPVQIAVDHHDDVKVLPRRAPALHEAVKWGRYVESMAYFPTGSAGSWGLQNLPPVRKKTIFDQHGRPLYDTPSE